MTVPILVAEDLSAVGGVSLGAAWTILNAFNQPVVGLPTSLLSTHTGGYGQPATQDLTDWLPEVFQHWQNVPMTYATILIGYLGQPQLVRLFQRYIQTHPTSSVILDPVMGDQGRLYQGFDQEYVQVMRQLLPSADVILPNLTEAQLLAQQDLADNWTLADLEKLVTRLQQLSDGATVLVTDVPLNGETGCVWGSSTGFHHIQQSRVAGHYFGSGDVLAATLTGLLNRGMDFDEAVTKTVAWVHQAIVATHAGANDSRWGIQIDSILRNILA